MDDELELTRAQLAQRIGFSAAVLRKWEKDFAEFVTSPAGVKGLAKARLYNLDDVLLFATMGTIRRGHAAFLPERFFRFYEGQQSGDILLSQQSAPLRWPDC